MTNTKYLRGPCSHCGATIQYPAQLVGTASRCPHCGKATELLLEVPQQEPVISRRRMVGIVVTILILVGGLAAAMIALKRAKTMVKERKPKTSVTTGQGHTTTSPPAR